MLIRGNNIAAEGKFGPKGERMALKPSREERGINRARAIQSDIPVFNVE